MLGLSHRRASQFCPWSLRLPTLPFPDAPRSSARPCGPQSLHVPALSPAHPGRSAPRAPHPDARPQAKG